MDWQTHEITPLDRLAYMGSRAMGALEYEPKVLQADDLTFSSGMNHQHTTDIAGSGNPRLKDIQRMAASAGITHWRELLEQVRAATRQWQTIATNNGVSATEMHKITAALTAIDQRIG